MLLALLHAHNYKSCQCIYEYDQELINDVAKQMIAREAFNNYHLIECLPNMYSTYPVFSQSYMIFNWLR